MVVSFLQSDNEIDLLVLSMGLVQVSIYTSYIKLNHTHEKNWKSMMMST